MDYITAGHSQPGVEAGGTGTKLDASLDGVSNNLQNLTLSGDLDSQRNAELMTIEEWIRQTSEVAVAPDMLVSGETRDTNSPTLTESSIKVSKVCSSKVQIILHGCAPC